MTVFNIIICLKSSNLTQKKMDIVKKIANYTYNERHCLGEGSFGRVYEGRSDQGLKVAIKRVQQSMISKDPYLRSSLQTQINIMKKLNHPNIIKLYDVVTTANSIYLIMQYCAGGDLKRYCRNRKLSEQEATNIVKSITKGFQQIAQLGIIHRDLKPANILVHEGVFKICDFGFAKFFNDASRMTRTCVGTPIYMSPQVLAQKSYTDKTDVWSLGVMYFELLFGKLPFYGATEDALYKNITRNPLQIPMCLGFTTNLLKGMLEIEENKRYSWNQMFQIFGLVSLENANGGIVEAAQTGNAYGFYKVNQRMDRKDSNQGQGKLQNEEFEPQIVNNYKEMVQNGQKIGSYDIIDNEQNKKGVPQRKPRNPLAYQNPVQPQQLQQPQIQAPQRILTEPSQPILQPPLLKARSSSSSEPENPRFLYFILVQLIVQPLKNCPTYPQLLSSICKKSIQLYTKTIEREKQKQKGNSLIGRVLAGELQELKLIQTQIPNYVNADLEKCAEIVYREAIENGDKRAVLNWIEKLVNKNYCY